MAGVRWLPIGWAWNSFIISASRPTAKRISGWMQDAALSRSSSITFWSGWKPDLMRYLVISDIHANLEAFETVMAAAKPLKYEKVLLLDDQVGAGVESPEGFNAVARNAIRWTYDNLSDVNREWLAALPAGPAIVDET